MSEDFNQDAYKKHAKDLISNFESANGELTPELEIELKGKLSKLKNYYMEKGGWSDKKALSEKGESTISPKIESKEPTDADVTNLVRMKFKSPNAKVVLNESPIGFNVPSRERSWTDSLIPGGYIPTLRNAMSHIDLTSGKPPFPYDYQSVGNYDYDAKGNKVYTTRQDKAPTLKPEAEASYFIPGVGHEIQKVKEVYQEQNSPLNRMQELIRKKYPQAELFEVPIGKTTNSLGGGVEIENPEKKVFVRLTPDGEIGPLYPDVGRVVPNDFLNRVVGDNEAQIVRGAGNIVGEAIGAKGGKTLLKLGAQVPGLLRRTTGNVVLPSAGAVGGGQLVDQYNSKVEAGLLNNTDIDPEAVKSSGALNSLKHILPDALTTGIFRGGAALLNKLTGKGPISPESEALIGDIRKMVEYNKKNGIQEDLPLGRYQHPEAGPISDRMSKQARATNNEKYANLERQQYQYVDKVVDDITKGRIENKEGIINYARDYYNNFQNKPVTKDSGGEAGKSGVLGSFKKEQETVITPAYEKADSLFRPGIDIIDITKVKNTANEISEQLKGVPSSGVEGVPVGPNLPPGMSKIINAINSQNDKQVDYNIIKQLRTDLGKEIENSSDQNIRRLGRQLYNDLTESYIGNGKTPFSLAIKEANKLAKNKFDLQELISKDFSPVFNKELGYKTYDAFSDKKALASKETGRILAFIKKHNPENHSTLIKSIRDNEIINAPNPVKAFNEFEKAGALKNITSGPTDRLDLKTLAQKSGEYKGSNTYKVLESINTAQTKFSNIMKVDNIFDAKSEFDLFHKALVATSKETGHNPQKILNTVVAEDLFNSKVIKQESVGGDIKFSYDRKALNNLIVRYKNTGIWDKLDDGSKVRLQGLNSFLKLLNNSKDIGTTLETAQIITNLKDPADFKSFGRGLRQLAANRMLALWFTSGSLGSRIFNQEIKPYTLRTMQNVNFILDSLMEGNESSKVKVYGVRPVGKVRVPDL